MLIPWEFTLLDVCWSMLYFALFSIWIWMLIVVFGAVLRSPDLSGWEKAMWSLFVTVLPHLGVFVYLIARGHKMDDYAHYAHRTAQEQEGVTRECIQSVTKPTSTADEIARLAELRDRGVITDSEFEQARATMLA